MQNKIKDMLKNPSKYIKVYLGSEKVFLLITVSFITILERAATDYEELERYRKLGSIEKIEDALKIMQEEKK